MIETDDGVFRSPVTGRFYDSLKVWRDLSALGVNDLTGHDRVTAIREAMSLPPICPDDGSGATEDTTIREFNAFSEYVRGKASRGDTSRRCVPCMGSPTRS